jgi:ferredoxin
MARKLYVDEEECIGCGLCSEIAPGVFHLNEEGISQVIVSSEELQDSIQEAIDECPVECIHWEDE